MASFGYVSGRRRWYIASGNSGQTPGIIGDTVAQGTKGRQGKTRREPGFPIARIGSANGAFEIR